MPRTLLGRLGFFGRELSRGLLHLLYPGTCHVCGTALPPEQAAFCASCRLALVTDPYPSCPRCGNTVGPFTQVEEGCSRCRGQSFHFESVLRLGSYEGLLRETILRLKHMHGETLAGSMGILWAEQAEARFRAIQADVVIPIPLHWWRRYRRGYNQSEELARVLAARLKVSCRPSWLRRIRATPPQTQVTASARRDNVRGAFRVRRFASLKGKCVLLVDDVLTTGSTASEAARALRDAGAKRVVVAVLAHSQS